MVCMFRVGNMRLAIAYSDKLSFLVMTTFLSIIKLFFFVVINLVWQMVFIFKFLWVFLGVNHELVKDCSKQPVQEAWWNIIEFRIRFLKSNVSCCGRTNVLEKVIKTLSILCYKLGSIDFWNCKSKNFVTWFITWANRNTSFVFIILNTCISNLHVSWIHRPRQHHFSSHDAVIICLSLLHFQSGQLRSEVHHAFNFGHNTQNLDIGCSMIQSVTQSIMGSPSEYL